MEYSVYRLFGSSSSASSSISVTAIRASFCFCRRLRCIFIIFENVFLERVELAIEIGLASPLLLLAGSWIGLSTPRLFSPPVAFNSSPFGVFSLFVAFSSIAFDAADAESVDVSVVVATAAFVDAFFFLLLFLNFCRFRLRYSFLSKRSANR